MAIESVTGSSVAEVGDIYSIEVNANSFRMLLLRSIHVDKVGCLLLRMYWKETTILLGRTAFGRVWGGGVWSVTGIVRFLTIF